MNDARTKIITALFDELQGVDTRTPCARRMTYTSLPWLTGEMFLGQPLRSVLLHPVSGTPHEIEAIFDTWAYPILEGEGDGIKDLIDGGYGSLVTFLRNFTETMCDMAVLMLFTLGHADDASLEIGDNTLMVTVGERRFGIKDGVVASRFTSGLALDIDPMEYLSRVHQVRTFDAAFVRYYRHAYQKGDEYVKAVIALKQSGHDFSPVLRKAKLQCVIPSESEIAGMEKRLFAKRDPIGSLYAAVVPTFMTRRQFCRHIWNMTVRPYAPTDEQRQLCFNKLAHYFYNKKKKNKKEAA